MVLMRIFVIGKVVNIETRKLYGPNEDDICYW